MWEEWAEFSISPISFPGIAAPVITGYLVARNSFEWVFGVAAIYLAHWNRRIHGSAGPDRADARPSQAYERDIMMLRKAQALTCGVNEMRTAVVLRLGTTGFD